MPKQITFYLLIFPLILFNSCSDRNSQEIENFKFPLQAGNLWEYKVELTEYYYSDTTGNIVYQDTIHRTGKITLTVVEKTDRDSIENLYQLVSKAEISNIEHINTGYYKNLNDGLYLYEVYSLGINLLPKSISNNFHTNKSKQLLSAFSGFLLSDKISCDKMTSSADLQKILPYPIKLNRQWTITDSDSLKIDKKIIDKDTINTKSGNFDCYIVEYLYDLDYDGEWDDEISVLDYYSEKGLISRHFKSEKNVHVTIDNPEGIGFFDIEQVFMLTDYEIAD
jgi:hypothetical protein